MVDELLSGEIEESERDAYPYEMGAYSLSSIEEPQSDYRTIQDYRDLRVWQLSMDLVVAIYQCTKALPADERFGLTNQLRRAAVSVPSNIAEGNARNSTADYLRFLRISRGSLAELNTQLLIAKRLDYLDERASSNVLTMTADLMRQLTSMLTAIEGSATRENRSP